MNEKTRAGASRKKPAKPPLTQDDCIEILRESLRVVSVEEVVNAVSGFISGPNGETYYHVTLGPLKGDGISAGIDQIFMAGEKGKDDAVTT